MKTGVILLRFFNYQYIVLIKKGLKNEKEHFYRFRRIITGFIT